MLAKRGELLLIRGLHIADGEPFAYEERLISIAAVPEIAEVEFTTEPPGSWLLRHIPWTEAENRIGATGADAKCAKLLGVAEGTACLRPAKGRWKRSASSRPITRLAGS
ncbi:UTRA domain-containing protein [Sphingobium rhizovicinum]|uniref:UTRA domain-containing protein n=1 Tax=Sphingobium rhizovicinum TaxID=432308 RepID=A0ABV7NLQ1_9SPHN